MLRHVFIIILVCILAVPIAGFAKGNKKPSAILHRDSSAVHVKKFNAGALSKYADDDDFKYTDKKNQGASLWQLFWAWFWYTIGNLFQRSGVSGDVFIYIIIGIGVAALLYVILSMAGMDIGALFRRNAKKASLPYYESLENIHEINFDEEIEAATNQRNYRLAVRLLYLKCLKQLNDAGLIRWQIDKTNTAYLYELTDAQHREVFGSLTRRFEYVWYGDFTIDESIYRTINLLFQQFKPGRK